MVATTRQQSAARAGAQAARDVSTHALQCVIFCDINGVLRRSGSRVSGWDWDDECAAALKSIVDATGARIVLSSSWRNSERQLQRVHRLLEKYQLPPLLGTTPRLGAEHAVRGDEILEWLRLHGEARVYVALDDDPLPVNKFKGTLQAARLDASFVRCESRQGLTSVRAALATVKLQPEWQSPPLVEQPRPSPTATADAEGETQSAQTPTTPRLPRIKALASKLALLKASTKENAAANAAAGSPRLRAVPSPLELEPGKRVRVIAEGDVRNAPGSDSLTIGRIAPGEVLEVTEVATSVNGRTYVRFEHARGFRAGLQPSYWTAVTKKNGTRKLIECECQ